MQPNRKPKIAGLKVGDRIRLIQMVDDPDPIPAGTIGTVTVIRSSVRCVVKSTWCFHRIHRATLFVQPVDHILGSRLKGLKRNFQPPKFCKSFLR